MSYVKFLLEYKETHCVVFQQTPHLSIPLGVKEHTEYNTAHCCTLNLTPVHCDFWETVHS